jgi:hypothetical protein
VARFGCSGWRLRRLAQYFFMRSETFWRSAEVMDLRPRRFAARDKAGTVPALR